MRAMAVPAYGPIDQLAAMTLPTPAPGRASVRVRVHASALNPADYKVLLGTMKFLHARRFPLVVGYDFSGVVEAVGPDVSDLREGDPVFGFLPYGPFNGRGAFAESLIAKASEVARLPPGVSHSLAAAAATPGLTALQMLRDLGRLPATGGRVLVTGASGGVGSLAIGIARRLGAEVTAIGSGRGLAQAERLGAARVIDRRASSVFSEAKGPYDIVLDAAAAYRWRDWRGTLVPGGAYLTTLPTLSFALEKLLSLFSRTRVGVAMVKARRADLELLGQWLASGLEVPIDSTVAVGQVGRGLERLHRGHAVGRIAVDVRTGFR